MRTKQVFNTMIVMVLTIVGQIGCSSQASSLSNNDDDESGIALVSVDHVSSNLEKNDLPTSVEDLEEAFVTAMELDLEAAFVDFADWSAVKESQRKEKLGEFLLLASSRQNNSERVLNSRLLTVDQFCAQVGYTVAEYNANRATPVTHVIELDLRLTDVATKTIALDVGSKDGFFYILTNVD